MMVRPGRALGIAALAITALSAVAYFIPAILNVLPRILAVLAPFILADLIVLLRFSSRPRVTRAMPVTLAQGKAVTVVLTITQSDKRLKTRTFTLFDCSDSLFDGNVFPARVHFPADAEELRFSYQLMPVERGNWEFPACEMLLPSPLCFWRLKLREMVVTQGRIYPDLSACIQGGAIEALIEQAGQKCWRKRGTGLEFDRLRGWQNGDSVRAIDWRATSRSGKFIIREYIEEQDQQVLFMLDSGYRLHRQEEGAVDGTQFDSALSAALFLSWAALKHGDAVAGAVFGNTERWSPPRRGRGALASLMNVFYDTKSAPCPSSIPQALEKALSRLKRRTFIVLISNFREEDEEQLSWILHHAGRRHLLLLANIIEPEIKHLARFEPQDGKRRPAEDEALLIAASAEAYLDARRRLMTRWESRGFLTLESPASALTPKLLTSYLAIKRSGAL